MYNGLKDFVEILEKNNELIRIKTKVSPILEISEIADRFSKQKYGGKALLFENNGTDFPVLINAFGSEKRISLALHHLHIEQIPIEIEQLIAEFLSPKDNLFKKIKSLPKLNKILKLTPKIIKGKAPAQEVIIKQPDLTKLPILKTWPLDASRFITLPLVHTKDPITGVRNVGIYRMQVLDRTTTAMHWHKHKTGARHYLEYKKMNKIMPVAVALGGDPVYTYVASAPLPDNIDEYLLASFIRKEPVRLVKAITQDIYVPADADIVLEGYIDPNEDLVLEGPFGDHTGFYSKPDYYPRFHITCITHRKDAIYPATVVGIPPQEDFYLSKATERIFIPLIRNTLLPELIDMDLPSVGVSHNFTIIRIKKAFEGHANKVMNTLWGAGQMMFNKIMIVVSEDVLDIHNYKNLAIDGLKNFSPEKDVVFFKGPLDILDHASGISGLGSKIGIDLTKKFQLENKPVNFKIDFNQNTIQNIKQLFPEITTINHNLLELDIPILIFGIRKKEKISNIAEKLVNQIDLKGIKIIIWLDDKFDVFDIYHTAWLVGNNIDPLRDVNILFSEKFEYFILSVDATEKSKEIDDYPSDWPKIITMDKKIIDLVDKKWNEYGFSDFIASPSLKFLNLP